MCSSPTGATNPTRFIFCSSPKIVSLISFDSGREGDFLATGFAMRKSGPTIYIMPGYNDYSALMEKLGPHKLGKSCLYFKKVADIDLAILKKIIAAGLRDLKKTYPVTMK